MDALNPKQMMEDGKWYYELSQQQQYSKEEQTKMFPPLIFSAIEYYEKNMVIILKLSHYCIKK